MSRTSDSRMLQARCEVKDPNASKIYGILPVPGGFWHSITRCREFSLPPAVTRWIINVHDSKFTMLFVKAFTDRFWLSCTLAWKLYIATRGKASKCTKSISSRVTMYWKAFVRSSLKICEPEKFRMCVMLFPWNVHNFQCLRAMQRPRTQAANAKDMDVDLRTPRGTVDDTAVLQVHDTSPLYFLVLSLLKIRRCYSAVNAGAFFLKKNWIRRCTSADGLPPM